MNPIPPDDASTLHAQCHCGLASYSVAIPNTALPLKSSICSCTSCRRTTGQLFATFAVVPGLPVPDVSGLASYASSSALTRVFCPRCGCSVLTREAGDWEFTGGVLRDSTRGMLDRQALFANDSVDGGGCIWLPERNGAGKEIRRHGGSWDSEVVDVKAMQRDFDTRQSSRTIPNISLESDTLGATCHCGAFQCVITRPSPQIPEPTPKRGKWWLASDEKRYQASLDACKDCRGVTGFEVNAWAYIPAANFLLSDGSPLEPADHPALKHYESSPGVHRDFCGTCGASVFYRKDSREPQVWDVGVGLLKADGARAEDWLEWGGIEYEGSALDPDFVSGIAQCMKGSK